MATASQRWSTAGAASTVNDYYDVLLDTQTVAAIGHEYVWNVANAVQEWLRVGVPNYGFLLVGGSGTQVSYTFVSSEALTPSTRPRLVIQYTTVPETTPTSTPSLTPTPTATATPQLGTLFVTVYNDLNRNRVPDVGKPGIPGVVVQLLNSARLELDSQVTGEDGTCTFAGLPPGPGLRVKINPVGYLSSADEYRLYIGRYLAVAFDVYAASSAGSVGHK